jgi:hypothetical protein
MEINQIPPRSEWKNLSILQLYEVKTQLMNTYFNMRQISASFYEQYAKFISEIDGLIRAREAEREEQG